MAKAMFPATPPRWITRSSTRKLSDTFCRCSASRCSENRPGNRIKLSVAIEPVTTIVTKFHPFNSKVRLAKRTGGRGRLCTVGRRPLASVGERRPDSPEVVRPCYPRRSTYARSVFVGPSFGRRRTTVLRHPSQRTHPHAARLPAAGRGLSGAVTDTDALSEACPPSTLFHRRRGGAAGGRRGGRGHRVRVAQRSQAHGRRILRRRGHVGDSELPGRPPTPRHRGHRPQRAVRYLRRGSGP